MNCPLRKAAIDNDEMEIKKEDLAHSVPAARKPRPPALETAKAKAGFDIKRIGADEISG